MISTHTNNNNSNTVTNNEIDFKLIESTINQVQNNNSQNNHLQNNQTQNENHNIKSINIKIPSGTQIRPARRTNGTYYMTLGTNVTVALKTKLTVNIDGTMFDAIVNDEIKNQESKNAQNIMNNKIIPIPAGTRYYINDVAIDQIGLMRVLDVNDEFHMAPGSKIILPANTVITLHKNTINNGTNSNNGNGGVPVHINGASQPAPPLPTPTNQQSSNNNQTNNQTTNIVRQSLFSLMSETVCTI